MVALRFSVWGFLFKQDVDILRTSFQSAMMALQANLEMATDEATGYQSSVDQGGERVGEWDDDGHQIWDNAEFLAMKCTAAADASMALRKAFVIAIYHHWERSARRWGSPNVSDDRRLDYQKLEKSSADAGIPLDPKLIRVKNLANTLKHNSKTCGCALLESWSTVFPQGFHTPARGSDWYESVQLTDTHVHEAFEIVLASGPSAFGSGAAARMAVYDAPSERPQSRPCPSVIAAPPLVL